MHKSRSSANTLPKQPSQQILVSFWKMIPCTYLILDTVAAKFNTLINYNLFSVCFTTVDCHIFCTVTCSVHTSLCNKNKKAVCAMLVGNRSECNQLAISWVKFLVVKSSADVLWSSTQTFCQSVWEMLFHCNYLEKFHALTRLLLDISNMVPVLFSTLV